MPFSMQGHYFFEKWHHFDHTVVVLFRLTQFVWFLLFQHCEAILFASNEGQPGHNSLREIPVLHSWKGRKTVVPPASCRLPWMADVRADTNNWAYAVGKFSSFQLQQPTSWWSPCFCSLRPYSLWLPTKLLMIVWKVLTPIICTRFFPPSFIASPLPGWGLYR